MIKSLFKSFGYKTVQTIVLTLYSVLLIPILLNYWELKVYGAWIALFTVFNLIQVIEFGHATYIGNQFNAIVKENAEKAKTVLGSALRANFITGFIQVTIVFLLFKSGFLKFLLDTDISDKTIATVLTILFLYRMLAGSFRGIIVKILNPFGLIYKSFQFATWERIIDFFILVISAITDITLIQLAIVWFVVKSVYSIGLLFILKRLLPDFFPWWKYGNFKLGIENFKDSIPFIFSNFLERLRNDGVVLIISAFIGTTFLPLFVATRAVVNFGLKISEIILNPLSPEIINLYVKSKLNKILDIFNAYWFCTGVLLISGYSISLFFINDLFTFWTHGKLTFNLGLYSALIVIFLIQNYGKIIFAFFIAINKTKLVLTTSFLRVLIFFSVAFASMQYGLYGILLAMFFSELLVNAFWLPYHSFTVLSIKKIDKLLYMLNLCAVLFVTVVFYLNYVGASFWVITFLSALLPLFFYYQYKSISKTTRSLLFNSLKSIPVFPLNKKKNVK